MSENRSDYRPKILAIDDTPANLVVLASALAGEFAFQLAASGPSGLEMAQSAPPDLILLDVMMPDVDGFETCRRFKADPRLRGIPIVFITALSDIGSEVDGLSLGAADFIHKPINIDIARQRIKNLLEREFLRREVEAHRDSLEVEVAQRTRELNQLNTDLRIALDAAEIASRTKSDFLANMSHEVRTPLNIMLGTSDLLLMKLTDPDLRMKAERIKHAGQGLLGIFEQIMLVAQMGSASDLIEARDFAVAGLLDDVLARIRPQAQAKNLDLVLTLSPGVPPALKGDARRLHQALENFLGNAVKFSEHGSITTRVQVISNTQGVLEVKFEVEDQGIGIPAEQLDHLFQPFAQGDNSSTRKFGGLGIGLAINKYLAGLMGGKIGVQSTPGQGSRFWITLPLAIGEAPATLSAEAGMPGETSAHPGQASGTAPSALVASPRAIRLAVDRLTRLLAGSDVDAIYAWNESRDLIDPLLTGELDAFQQAMTAFDFPAALALIRKALQRHPELENLP